jgi:chromosome segregation ATPase
MTTTDTTALEQAEQTLAGLDAALLRLKARGTELADEQASIALSAHTGDEKARKRLDAINREIAVHGSEVNSLHIAVKAAEANVASAKQEEQRAEARANALKLRDELKTFVRLGQEMDEHLAAFAALADESKASAERINALGHGSPNAMQFLTFGGLAVNSVLMFTPWKREVAVHLAPKDRRTFSSLFAGWAQGAERAVATTLGESTKENAA